MSGVFDAVAKALARATGLTSTQARGTLRLMLRDSGIDPQIARKADLRPLLAGPLQDELAKRRVALGAPGAELLQRALDAAPEHDDAYDLFSDSE